MDRDPQSDERSPLYVRLVQEHERQELREFIRSGAVRFDPGIDVTRYREQCDPVDLRGRLRRETASIEQCGMLRYHSRAA